ncbi:MAG TPA: hypothetical protein VKB89_25760 [Xanthobacteraceae bacterium]|nr:hypothetical protein [Xanthobacteraceae bacterium]
MPICRRVDRLLVQVHAAGFEMLAQETVYPSQVRFIRMKSASKKRAPSIKNLTVNRRYLTEREAERLMDCARKHDATGIATRP